MECVKPLEEKLSEMGCVISAEPDMHALMYYHLEMDRITSNAVMACRPRHPFFKYLVDDLAALSQMYKGHILESTGPLMLLNAYTKYQLLNYPNVPTLAESEYFHPIGDPREMPKQGRI